MKSGFKTLLRLVIFSILLLVAPALAATNLDGKKLLVVCANGAGSSLMMKMTLQKVLKKHDAKPSQIHHCSIAEAKNAAANFDVVFCARNFAKTFNSAKSKGTTVIPLKNIMSDKEIEAGLKNSGLLD